MKARHQQEPLLALELELVQNILIEQTKSGDPKFDAVILDWVSQRGKMLRPAFYLLASRFGMDQDLLSIWQWQAIESPEQLLETLREDKERMQYYKGAAAIELVHMASLIHDDVIDEAKLRRGRPSIQSVKGKDYAVYMGDYFFCKAMLMVSDHEFGGNLKTLAQGMTQVCLGEIRQYHSRNVFEPDLRNYFKIIASKTAALFALSLYAGAFENQEDKRLASNLGKAGYNVGMAFQIMDDLLDYDPEAQMGKETYKDLIQGNINLPIHLALKSLKQHELTELLTGEQLDFDTFLKVVGIIHETHADTASKRYAQKYTKRALKYLSRVPEGDTRELLRQIFVELLEREL